MPTLIHDTYASLPFLATGRRDDLFIRLFTVSRFGDLTPRLCSRRGVELGGWSTLVVSWKGKKVSRSLSLVETGGRLISPDRTTA